MEGAGAENGGENEEQEGQGPAPEMPAKGPGGEWKEQAGWGPAPEVPAMPGGKTEKVGDV